MRYKQEVRDKLWPGSMPEADFWRWLGEQAPAMGEALARRLLQDNLKPLPALDLLAGWSQVADIHLLSNHLSAWVAPGLASVQAYLRSITLSSQVGCCKPHPGIFEAAAAQLQGNGNGVILFVDDQEKNLQQAARLGWDTLLADPQGEWTDQVISRLEGSS
nr:HAD-IA family hydrolase [Paenibacillus cremeus]